ncbi:Protein of unknown function DUF1288 [Ignisphaera aggregans DSM 17230]|uniref:Uncharacterized protein n=1 Tax=Ignisphaera aggregans (strain DSM 17230 / JCM 13409 / AQ1.S1) TaxID=583356 RepID=E0SQW8_IGNAA|nr:Protein of unknown function DUF1288 [Ignisphaera aggregans DSM 17230]
MTLELELLNNLYILKPVRVMVLRYFSLEPFMNLTLQKGSEISLPRWIAEILEKNGIVEILDRTITPQELSKIKFSQMQQKSQIIRIEDFFYIKMKKTIEDLETKAKKEGDINLLKIVEKMREDFADISRLRLSFIIRAVQLGGLDVIEKNLAIEEKLLVNLIKSTLSTWSNKFALI